jgi:hypothetical protein
MLRELHSHTALTNGVEGLLYEAILTPQALEIDGDHTTHAPHRCELDNPLKTRSVLNATTDPFVGNVLDVIVTTTSAMLGKQRLLIVQRIAMLSLPLRRNPGIGDRLHSSVLAFRERPACRSSQIKFTHYLLILSCHF